MTDRDVVMAAVLQATEGERIMCTQDQRRIAIRVTEYVLDALDREPVRVQRDD